MRNNVGVGPLRRDGSGNTRGRGPGCCLRRPPALLPRGTMSKTGCIADSVTLVPFEHNDLFSFQLLMIFHLEVLIFKSTNQDLDMDSVLPKLDSLDNITCAPWSFSFLEI